MPSLLSPDDLQTLQAFEAEMLLSFPELRGKEPIYFARSHDVRVYLHPEARLAFKGFLAGVSYAAKMLRQKFN